MFIFFTHIICFEYHCHGLHSFRYNCSTSCLKLNKKKFKLVLFFQVWLLQFLVVLLLIIFNILMFSHFNHALQLSSTTLHVSVINTASNFLTTVCINFFSNLVLHHSIPKSESQTKSKININSNISGRAWTSIFQRSSKSNMVGWHRSCHCGYSTHRHKSTRQI